jgi:hypothetical protein
MLSSHSQPCADTCQEEILILFKCPKFYYLHQDPYYNKILSFNNYYLTPHLFKLHFTNAINYLLLFFNDPLTVFYYSNSIILS